MTTDYRPYLSRGGGATKKLLVALLVTLVTLTVWIPRALAQTAPTINNPPVAPHSIIAFPQRDFVSASGYAATDKVTVSVVHKDGTEVGRVTGIVPQDDPQTPEFDGLVEVNHPGGACWVGVTPDIRAGDKVRITVEGSGVADETTVADVTAKRPVQTAPDTVQVHGTAQDAAGNPLPLDQLEQRLVVPNNQFALNGKRTLRAPGNGDISYDASGSINWTATYTGLSAADVTKALGAESRGMWLGSNPLAAVESTIFENGAGAIPGPAAPCTAPLEKLPPPPGSELEPPTAPSGLSATANLSSVTLDWTAATDNVGVTSYGIYRNGVAIANVQKPDGTAPAPTTFVDKNLPAGDYTYTVDAADAVGNRGPLSNEVTVTTTVNPAPITAVNEPPVLPHSIIGFPQRDFVSAQGYAPDDIVDVFLIRDGAIIGSATGLIPQDDERTDGFDGLVEVNHPGGGCWEGTTPWMMPGDQIRLVTNKGDRDQTTVSNVTAKRPVQTGPDSIAIHGTAQDAKGNPIDLGQVEERLVANRDAFDLSGKRTLRAPGNGDVSYDVPGSINWTATYKGIDAADMDRALNRAESRVLWLGHDPLAGAELTIYEVGTTAVPVDKGPSAPCTAPTAFKPPAPAADTTAPDAPTNLDATVLGGNDVKLTWTKSSSADVIGYGVYRDDKLVGEVRGDRLADSPLTFTDSGVAQGTYNYTVKAFDAADNHSAASNSVTANTVDVPPAPGAVNEPPKSPHSIISFPQRDFVSATGYAQTDQVRVDIVRGGNVVSSTPDITPQDDPGTPGFDGLVEVNHPGGGCWNVNTPDIRPGDKVRLTVTNSGALPDQTTSYDVTAQRPVQTASDTVVIHGTAVDPATGGPVDIGQLEQRLVSGKDLFDLNGKRTLRAGAGAEGTLTYDAPGSTKWTATYKGLSAADVTRALAAESRAVWLGHAPLVGNELTIYENGPGVVGGPSTPDCTAPLEPSAPQASATPASLNFGNQSAVPATTSTPKNITLSNSGTSDVKVSDTYIAGANPGDFAIGSKTCPATLAAGASCTVNVTFSPKAVGARTASLNLRTNAANQGDISTSLTGNGINAAAPSAPGAPAQSLPTVSQLLVDNAALANSKIPVKLNWTASTGTVTSYQLQQSTNGGAFTDVTPQPGTASSTTLNLAMGTTAAPSSYQFQVRACNGADCSAWVSGPNFKLAPIDDSNRANLSYGGTWTTQALAGAYGGSVSFASTAKDKVQFNKLTYTVPGSSIAWVSTLGPDRGKATVTVDGGPAQQVDLYSATRQPAKVVFAANNLNGPAEHTITVQILGTKNASSTGTRVDMDAIVALGATPKQ
ncbi:MAG TPA: choice-of-anchor D domain-containing protein [Rubrobacteraceae bacterium]|nr:choice-of-anchor D domain-containing protein [Rubrobacteraceae bacterium]